MREVWRPALAGGPKWGFSYDFSPRTSKLAFIAAESNWTVRCDLYIVDPANWQVESVWSDPANDHEDGAPRWAARTNRIAWTHAVPSGLSPRDHVIGIVDITDDGISEPRWICQEFGDLWLYDWTDDDNLLVLDKTTPQNRLCIVDDTGKLIRELRCERDILNARWRKYARTN